jgi:hypothetical protein
MGLVIERVMIKAKSIATPKATPLTVITRWFMVEASACIISFALMASSVRDSTNVFSDP